ncbi:COP23 domain-containing protein [Spirulina sp. CS-785/01]|uniref:COP23 domain-containing protein n=1 Tax=Spirulina sp. CS-785/01 TaxID=3021716 RepID=UPI00232F415A|nr:COP23 domain-containing protein [Spirulina sp. CS-785/01]MDB9311579.1 COP23 domain-containing protein [Spirulina sp. CS-785/01]
MEVKLACARQYGEKIEMDSKIVKFFQQHPAWFVIAAIMMVLGGVASTLDIIAYAKVKAEGNVVFNCSVLQNTDSSDPAYYTTATRGNSQHSLIHWESGYFVGSGFTPERRCKEVAPRFQRAYDDGKLNLVTNGTMNNQPVICTTFSEENSGCDQLLFTLRPQDRPLAVLDQLENALKGRKISAIPQSAGEPPQVVLEVNPDAVFAESSGESGFETVKYSALELFLGLFR